MQTRMKTFWHNNKTYGHYINTEDDGTSIKDDETCNVLLEIDCEGYVYKSKENIIGKFNFNGDYWIFGFHSAESDIEFPNRTTFGLLEAEIDLAKILLDRGLI